jgi:hypothetical protein
VVLDCKQKRAFQTVLSGLKFARYGNKKVRFLTLTTSEIQGNSDNDLQTSLNLNFQILYKRIKRYSPYRLFKEGYISKNKLTSVYGRNDLFKKFSFEYFKVLTNEGNGVLHILYRGSYLPYNFIVDNWQDIHNSWDLNIKLIDLTDPKDSAGYVVSQYVSHQRSSYVRSSQSWNWVFRGFKSLWYSMVHFYKDNLFELWDSILLTKARDYFYPISSLDDFT